MIFSSILCFALIQSTCIPLTDRWKRMICQHSFSYLASSACEPDGTAKMYACITCAREDGGVSTLFTDRIDSDSAQKTLYRISHQDQTASVTTLTWWLKVLLSSEIGRDLVICAVCSNVKWAFFFFFFGVLWWAGGVLHGQMNSAGEASWENRSEKRSAVSLLRDFQWSLFFDACLTEAELIF